MNKPSDQPLSSESSSGAINPYEPVWIEESAQLAEEYQPASLRRTFGRWFLICTISAAPSFLAGYLITEGEAIGMIAGILLFIVVYTVVDHRTSEKSWRRNRSLRRTLKVTYGTRIAISLIFPVGFAADIYCFLGGMFLTQAITGQEFTDLFPGETASAFAATIVQGCILNVVLAFYGLIVFGICKVFEAGGSK